jgi:rhamnosyltransferase
MPKDFSISMHKVSVVIRTYNEAVKLRRLLEFLKNDPVQVVVVDNGSTDETPQLIQDYGVTSVWLDQKEFTYPKSLNLGIAAAIGDIIVTFSGHCLPVHRDWLETVVRHFEDPQIAGIYGPVCPESDSPLFEKITGKLAIWRLQFKGVTKQKREQLGLLGATNSAIRRSLWQDHNYNEAWAAGAEDSEWGRWAIDHKYNILFDPHFLVIHSHYLTFIKMIKQQHLWRRLKRGPQAFNREYLDFRDDIKHS